MVHHSTILLISETAAFRTTAEKSVRLNNMQDLYESEHNFEWRAQQLQHNFRECEQAIQSWASLNQVGLLLLLAAHKVKFSIAGIEPTTSRLRARRYNHWSFVPLK